MCIRDRGMKAHCTFCGLNGNTMQYRVRSYSGAIEMLNQMFLKYGDRVKHYFSADNIMPKDYIENVFPFLALPTGASIFYEVKADLNRNEMQKMASHGVTAIQPGIEALDTTILKHMKKGGTAVNNVAILKYGREFDIDIEWNLLIGFPDEPEEAYRKYEDGFRMFYHLQPPKAIFSVRFDRFSPYHQHEKSFGLSLKPAGFYKHLYPHLSSQTLSNLAYFFEDGNMEAGYKLRIPKKLPALSKSIEAWNKKYNTNEMCIRDRISNYINTGHRKYFSGIDHPFKSNICGSTCYCLPGVWCNTWDPGSCTKTRSGYYPGDVPNICRGRKYLTGLKW